MLRMLSDSFPRLDFAKNSIKNIQSLPAGPQDCALPHKPYLPRGRPSCCAAKIYFILAAALRKDPQGFELLVGLAESGFEEIGMRGTRDA